MHAQINFLSAWCILSFTVYVIALIITESVCAVSKEICTWGEDGAKVLRSTFEVLSNVCCSVPLQKRDCVRGLSALSLQAVWGLGAGCQAEGSLVLERLPGCSQLTVSGLLPVPVLCLHVACYHLRGTAGRSH